MTGNNGNGNGHTPLERTSSGLEIEVDGEHKPITEVINTFELVGDEVRANLMASIRAAIMAAREARRAAQSFVLEEQALQG